MIAVAPQELRLLPCASLVEEAGTLLARREGDKLPKPFPVAMDAEGLYKVSEHVAGAQGWSFVDDPPDD